MNDRPDEDDGAPYSLQAEQALLGGLLFNNESVWDVADTVRSSDFWEPFHQRLYDAIVATVRMGRLAEPAYLDDFFTGDPAYTEFGGIEYLRTLLDRAPAKAAKHHAETVADLSLRRQLLGAGHDILRCINDRTQSAMDLVLAAERLVGDVSTSGPAQTAFVTIGEIYAAQIAKSRDMKGEPPGISTGIPDLDRKLGGLRKKNVIVIAGRPGMGKSAAAVTLALNVGSPQEEAPKGRGVGFFSLEMPGEQVSTRFGCALAYQREAGDQNPTYEKFERGELTEAQWALLEHAGQRLASMPIHLDFRSKLKVSQILAACRRLKRDWARAGIEPGVIIIDHVLQVQPEKRLNDKVVEISQIADDILDMAKVLDMPVVLLCQLGREVDKREDKRPILADLKWSGSLEENAAAVIFCYRPEYYNKEPAYDAKESAWAIYNKVKARYTNRLVFLLEKNRNGRANQEIETWCDIGANAIEQLSSPMETRTLDFSASRLDQDGAFDSLTADDVR